MSEERVEKAIAELQAALDEYAAEKGMPNPFAQIFGQFKAVLTMLSGTRMTPANPDPYQVLEE